MVILPSEMVGHSLLLPDPAAAYVSNPASQSVSDTQINESNVMPSMFQYFYRN